MIPFALCVSDICVFESQKSLSPKGPLAVTEMDSCTKISAALLEFRIGSQTPSLLL